MAIVRKESFPEPLDLTVEKGSSLWSDAWHRLLQNKLAIFSLFTFVIISLLSFGTQFSVLITEALGHPWSPTGYLPNRMERSLEDSPPLADIFDYSVVESGKPDLSKTYAARIKSLLQRNPVLNEDEIEKWLQELKADRESGTSLYYIRPPQLIRSKPDENGQSRILSPRYATESRLVDTLEHIANNLNDNPLQGAAITSAQKDAILSGNVPPQLIHIEQRVFRDSPQVHLLGTDVFGRDLMTRIFAGGSISIGVGLAATTVSLIIGVLYGAIAGFLGGKTDMIMMRFVDVLYAMPFLIFVILLMTLFGRSLFLMFLAIGAVEWLTMARIVRGLIATLKQQEFVEAAVSLGHTKLRIILRHLLPNILGTVIVYTTLLVPAVILLEGVLSFLGLGVQDPHASWGILINEGKDAMETSAWLLIFPALFFSLALFSLNFLGDGLRDALDPQASKD